MQALTLENGQRLTTLNHHGIDVNAQALVLRHLIQTLFPTAEEQHELNCSFQQLLAETISSAEAQVDRINLERSAQQASGLIVPGVG